MFKALLVEKDEGGRIRAAVTEMDEDRLPEEDVTVAVEYSALNYKDWLLHRAGGWTGGRRRAPPCGGHGGAHRDAGDPGARGSRA